MRLAPVVPPAALAAGAIVARALMRNVPARLHADFTQPLVVATNWGRFGAITLTALVVALGIAAAPYVWSLRSQRAPSLAALTLGATAALAAAWLMPVLFSSDVYAYAAYGALANLGIDPYVRAPAVPHDTLLSAAAWQWGGALPVCVYGPAFVGLARSIVAAFSSLGSLATLDALRAVASLSLLACAPLAYAAFGGDERAKRLAAMTLVANPVTLWCAAEGHNDALALAVALTGVGLVRSGWFGLGAIVAAFSALFKLPGILCTIGVAAIQRRARIGSALGIILVAALCVPLFVGIASALAPNGHYLPQASLQGAIAPIAGSAAAIAAAVAISATIALWGIRELRNGSSEGWIRLGLAGWILIPNPYPWYSIWLLALAAIAPQSRPGYVAILFSFASLLRYVPDAVGPLSGAPAVAAGVTASLPLCFLFIARRAGLRA
ncbi:MAG: hypothetical protein JO263_08525 [Candidatus Eremiobacteraeota bacterium]|nr:hypothetical protein [Candidatus Eremiobacteraeota bacterium]